MHLFSYAGFRWSSAGPLHEVVLKENVFVAVFKHTRLHKNNLLIGEVPYSNCDLGYKENEMSSVGHYLLTERTRDDGKMIFLKRRWKCLWSFSVA